MYSNSSSHQVPLSIILLTLFTFSPQEERGQSAEALLYDIGKFPIRQSWQRLGGSPVSWNPLLKYNVGLVLEVGLLGGTPHGLRLPDTLPSATSFFCLLPAWLLFSTSWELSADQFSSVCRCGISLFFCRAYCLCQLWFPTAWQLLLDHGHVDGTRSKSTSPFSFQLLPSEGNISMSDCQTTHHGLLPHIAPFLLFFTPRGKEVSDRFPVGGKLMLSGAIAASLPFTLEQ